MKDIELILSFYVIYRADTREYIIPETRYHELVERLLALIEEDER